ncbi:MAG: hypothetical protein WCJ61_08215 [Paludibacter sp.]
MEKPTFNKKHFLLPNSHRSMSCYHAKVMEDGIMKLTIHDCKRSVQLKNDLNNQEEIKEAIDKLKELANGALQLMEFIQDNYIIKQESIYFQLQPSVEYNLHKYVSE